MCAYLAFRYSLVFCPVKRKICHLNPFDPNNLGIEESFDYLALTIARQYLPNLEFLGETIDDSLMIRIAYGKVNPRTNKEFELV